METRGVKNLKLLWMSYLYAPRKVIRVISPLVILYMYILVVSFSSHDGTSNDFLYMTPTMPGFNLLTWLVKCTYFTPQKWLKCAYFWIFWCTYYKDNGRRTTAYCTSVKLQRLPATTF